MKNLKYYFSIILVTLLFGCSQEDSGNVSLDGVTAPANMSALFTITQDNSGKVTIYPNSEGATSYDVYFGDGTLEATTMTPSTGGVEHVYAEGTYEVRIVAFGITGLQTEYKQTLTVSFIAPTELEIIASDVSGNAYQKDFTAKANYETYFEIYFGEDPLQTPVQFNEGQTVSHTYSAVGTYTVRVVALSGGVATSEETTTVTVLDPLVLPITFETASVAFGDFGGAAASVIDNPVSSGINTSSKVGRIFKNPGAEIWAGTSFPLDEVIDFSVMKLITIKTYSPAAGKIVKLKLENLTNNTIATEVDAVTTVANGWETLTFNFAGANNASNFQRVVLFYDFGNNGSGTNFYFDDIKQISGLPQVVLPLTFEDPLTYTFTGFGGANAEVVNNPQSNGINTSSKVGKQTKNGGSETWAGAFIELQQPIDFSSMHKLKVKVWSPQAGITVKLKLENLPNSANLEVDATTTVANQWEELTYDFSAAPNANNYQRVVLFFNFGSTAGATYYFDDIKLSN